LPDSVVVGQPEAIVSHEGIGRGLPTEFVGIGHLSAAYSHIEVDGTAGQRTRGLPTWRNVVLVENVLDRRRTGDAARRGIPAGSKFRLGSIRTSTEFGWQATHGTSGAGRGNRTSRPSGVILTDTTQPNRRVLRGCFTQ